MIMEERLDTAKEFLDTLRITNPRWISKDNKWQSSWVYRGQADSKWYLQPSAWRSSSLERFKKRYRARFEEIHISPLKDELANFDKLLKSGEISKDEYTKQTASHSKFRHCQLELHLQCFAEMLAIKEFTEFADKLGHPVPGANEYFRPYQTNYKDLREEEFLISQFACWSDLNNPFNVNSSAVALAQHHGIPTRLLDWTENPLIAAFFAAEKITDKMANNDRDDITDSFIAVWAISKEILQDSLSDHINISASPSTLKLIKRPRHEIGYLLAQEGVFIHDRGANDYFREHGKWPSFEEVINSNPDYLKKITLPLKEVGELLRLLWLEGISRAHLMPTYDNVTRALQTKSWWEDRWTGF